MEDFEMFARKALFASLGRATVMATVAAVALTAVEPSLARAGSAAARKGVSAAAATSGATDFRARRRYYRSSPAYYGGDPYYGGNTYYGGNPYYGGYGYRHSGVPYFNGHPNAGW